MGLPLPTLMLVTDRTLASGEDALVDAVAAAVAGGLDALQLREKDLPPDRLLALARRLREITADRALLIVNGPLEVALAADADGVHLPESAPLTLSLVEGPVERPARPFIVGQSVHSRAAAERAWADCREYLIAGPIYETRSHPGATPVGLRLIEDVAGSAAIPVLAIGGITAERVEPVLRAGASGVAVISAVLAAPSPRDAARRLRAALDAAWAETRAVRP